MKPTKLLFLNNMQQLECTSIVEDTEERDGKITVYLDQTVFYPQGGGQPYDTGIISSAGVRFAVGEVRFVDGRVLHIGTFESGRFVRDDAVQCSVDETRRLLNTHIHSAGHVLDMAVDQLDYDWVPGKGYHFPDSPYVEYEGNIEDQMKETIARGIEKQIALIIEANAMTKLLFVLKEDASKYCRHVPNYLPDDKPCRIVLYGDFGVPCGGTHVVRLKDIGAVTIRKVKAKAGVIRVSYKVSSSDQSILKV